MAKVMCCMKKKYVGDEECRKIREDEGCLYIGCPKNPHYRQEKEAEENAD